MDMEKNQRDYDIQVKIYQQCMIYARLFDKSCWQT